MELSLGKYSESAELGRKLQNHLGKCKMVLAEETLPFD